MVSLQVPSPRVGGGGTGDKCIHFWNTDTGDMLDSINTHGQMCALEWNRREREILSSHGYPHGQRSTMCLWRYPSLKKKSAICRVTTHGSRVLHMAQSPDGRTVVSGATDQTLRFWNWSAFDGAHEGGGYVGGARTSSMRTRSRGLPVEPDELI